MEDLNKVFEDGIEDIDAKLEQLDKELMEKLNTPSPDAKPYSPKETTKVYYLNDENEEVAEEEATKMVMQVFDENDNMIQEVWGTPTKDIPTEEDNAEYTEVYVDDDNNEVSKEEATYVILRKIVDGKVEEEDKYPLEKVEEGMIL